MKIDHDLWRNGVIKSQFERQNNQITDSIDYVGCNDPLISSSAQLNELTDPSKLTHFHHSIPSSQFGLYKGNTLSYLTCDIKKNLTIYSLYNNNNNKTFFVSYYYYTLWLHISYIYTIF